MPTLLAAALAALPAPAHAQAPSSSRLEFVTSVRQPGPVGYRDPIGIISWDGSKIALAAGRRLAVQSIIGGPTLEMGTGENDILDLAWFPDSQHLAVRERTFDHSATTWFRYDAQTGAREPLWPTELEEIRGISESDAAVVAAFRTGSQSSGDRSHPDFPPGLRRYSLDPNEILFLAFSPNTDRVAGLARDGDYYRVWTFDQDGGNALMRETRRRLSYPVWLATGSDVACLAITETERQPQIELRCGAVTRSAFAPAAYGRIAFSPDRQRVYYGAPEFLETLDLWVRGLPQMGGGAARRLTGFTRDTYDASASQDGKVLFKTQDFHAYIASVPAEGGPVRAVTAFQSELPSWDPTGTQIGLTFGSWRRATDDIRYPDIDRHLGTVGAAGTVAATSPHGVPVASPSEDQGMHWSPNGKWIVYHSHAEGSDDIWLVPADRSEDPERISSGGRETGWPRWSPDGRWIVYPSLEEEGGALRGGLYLIGVDQESGEVTSEAQRIPLDGLSGQPSMAEWSPDSESLVLEADDAGAKGIYVASRTGGTPRLVHAFESEQMYSGVSASPDFEWAAFIAPDTEGYYQLFRVPIGGGEPQQLTFDPTNKVHPAYSPDGAKIAFTVFSYEALFWLLVEES